MLRRAATILARNIDRSSTSTLRAMPKSKRAPVATKAVAAAILARPAKRSTTSPSRSARASRSSSVGHDDSDSLRGDEVAPTPTKKKAAGARGLQTTAAVPRKPARVVSSSFDYGLDFTKIDFRKRPELYRVGRGEQGVLSCQPYKGEILPHWRFATPEKAAESSEKIYQMFLDYLSQKDFIGADMARKFLQMGFTRSRRYANHKGGKKYDGPVPADKKGLSGSHGRPELPKSEVADPDKAASALIFKKRYNDAMANEEYQRVKIEFGDFLERWKEEH